MPMSAAKIRLVKTAQRSLALDDATYRSALLAWGGVESAKHLSEQGFRDLMSHFERCGFEPRSTFQPTGKKTGRLPSGMATDKQIKKIYASWWSLGGSYYTRGNERRALREFLRKRFNVSHENFLDFETAHKAIEAIKAIQERHPSSSRRGTP